MSSVEKNITKKWRKHVVVECGSKRSNSKKEESIQVTMQEQICKQLGKIQGNEKKGKENGSKSDEKGDCKRDGKVWQEHHNIFKFVKSIKNDGKDIEGGQCIRNNGGRLGLTSTDKKENLERT